jgi:hypothetical protein
VGTRGLMSADRWVWDPRLRVSQRGFAERAEAGAAPWTFSAHPATLCTMARGAGLPPDSDRHAISLRY